MLSGSYCSVCGSQMLVVEWSADAFDGRTGEKVKHHWVVCPNFRQRKVLFWSKGNGHECCEASPNYFADGNPWIKERDAFLWRGMAPSTFRTLPATVYERWPISRWAA